MKPIFLWLGCILLSWSGQAQELPHRMRVGLSVDLGGNTLGIGAQLHGSFRLTNNYRAFDDQNRYLNAGVGIGATLSSGLSVGMSVPHYVTYGFGSGRAMWELGIMGVRHQKLTTGIVTNPQTGEITPIFNEYWKYLVLPLAGYRYTAYSGFMFRINGPIPGIAFGWIF